MGNPDPLGTASLVIVIVNMAYVGLHLWRDAQVGSAPLILCGGLAFLASIGGVCAVSLLWWLDYTDFSIGW